MQPNNFAVPARYSAHISVKHTHSCFSATFLLTLNSNYSKKSIFLCGERGPAISSQAHLYTDKFEQKAKIRVESQHALQKRINAMFQNKMIQMTICFCYLWGTWKSMGWNLSDPNNTALDECQNQFRNWHGHHHWPMPDNAAFTFTLEVTHPGECTEHFTTPPTTSFFRVTGILFTWK